MRLYVYQRNVNKPTYVEDDIGVPVIEFTVIYLGPRRHLEVLEIDDGDLKYRIGVHVQRRDSKKV